MVGVVSTDCVQTVTDCWYLAEYRSISITDVCRLWVTVDNRAYCVGALYDIGRTIRDRVGFPRYR